MNSVLEKNIEVFAVIVFAAFGLALIAHALYQASKVDFEEQYRIFADHKQSLKDNA